MNLVVTGEARAFRRAVGVTAWCVLEELVLDARDDDGALVAQTNVRAVAGRLGVSKDTAARTIHRLVRAGVVRRVTSARGERGALPTSSYVIDLSTVDGLNIESDCAAPAPRLERVSPTTPIDNETSPRRRTMRPASRVDDAQTSLFDLPASAS